MPELFERERIRLSSGSVCRLGSMISVHPRGKIFSRERRVLQERILRKGRSASSSMAFRLVKGAMLRA